jgi:outer membrane immunogenic protein
MKIFTYTLAALVSAATLPAFAQNADGFSGFSAGTEIGIQKNKIEVTAPGAVNFKDSSRGYALRGFAGYDFAISDSLILGGEAGLSLGGPSVKKSSDTARFRADPGVMFDISARAGLAVSESVLLYGRAGYSNSKIDISASNTAVPGTATDRDKRKGGLLLGAGGEWAMSDALNLRAEYRRAKHGDLKSDQLMLGGVIRF